MSNETKPGACEICGGAGFINHDDAACRARNGGKWGRCLSCHPYDEAAPAEGLRFFIDHDCIHDRLTGRHIHGDRDVEPGVADEAVAMLNELSATRGATTLTDDQCDAIYTALDEWAAEISVDEYGLPAVKESARGIIRAALAANQKGAA